MSSAVPGFDEIFIDNIMFKHMELTQGALEIIEARYSLRETLVTNLKEMKYWCLRRRAAIQVGFRNCAAPERNAETHELGELEMTLIMLQTNRPKRFSMSS